MFADVHHFTKLFDSSWPAVNIGDEATYSGNSGAHWNVGQNFGGPLKDSWASGADTVHDGGVGMFGSMGVNAPLYYPGNSHPCDALKGHSAMGYGNLSEPVMQAACHDDSWDQATIDLFKMYRDGGGYYNYP